MSQVNDFIFGTEGYQSLQQQPSLLRTLTGLRKLPMDNSPLTVDSQKVIGASYSHLDLGASDTQKRNSSPDSRSVHSSGSTKSPRPSLNLAKAKKLYDLSAKIDDDADWNDDIDDLTTPSPQDPKPQFYPDISDLKLQESPMDRPTASTEPPAEPQQQAEAQPAQFLCPDYERIMKDPFVILERTSDQSKYSKIVKALKNQPFDMAELRKQTWSGVPAALRPLVWQVLLGYLPVNSATRESVLRRKRKEYTNSMTQLFRAEKDQAVWHQISIDIPRTNPTIKLYSFESTQRSLEKVLYLWAVRHPASGYVQGINDLATPFYQIFLSAYLCDHVDMEAFNTNQLPQELVNCIEADTYWCLTKVLDTIQDNYIHEQPGIIRQVSELRDLVKRDEPYLAEHFEHEGIDFIQFSFRWMNCMLMRELRMELIVRMWDTYLSSYPTGFNQFHIYVCCAFLRRFSEQLLEMDFQDMLMFLQDTSKTSDWTEADVEMMLSEAFVWQSLYENATAHFRT
ncbi:hypothetical protein KL905_002427 [Ogataea polymorpha]|uniref:uncharacterized protein n=1 Tax=Ogataea polymorpha TaxID=460523 RepID=UPI0007F522C2|nr:uncharacterized protein OGAPODRAFT_15231 [Ogataea polymorpha]KAG7894715.1 hypothetical protein KL908_002087 [Ogataea polymorpha]KAG7899691.1 hypothetical protein KL935_003232 [Ogataea polymorpha]KAG7906531.1 hypothetical protein KL907_002171 [Ogataea polymorpha]KAG7909778.1 hypothetical protein KL906_001683 [Ogataea polymorpha]KAG7917478.1 hypothetical protein KL927_002221 [Ogataea polymorpha]